MRLRSRSALCFYATHAIIGIILFYKFLLT